MADGWLVRESGLSPGQSSREFHYNVLGDSYFVLLSDLVDACVYKIHGDIAYVVPPRGAVLRDLIN